MTTTENHRDWQSKAFDFVSKFENITEDDFEYLAKDFAHQTGILEERAQIYVKKALDERFSTSTEVHDESQDAIEKNETLPPGSLAKRSKIDPGHLFILKNLRYVEFPALLVDSFIQKTKKSRATFFRKINQLEKWGLIVRIGKETPRHFRLNPMLKNSSLIFLVGGVKSSLTFESTSQTAPIDEKPVLVQDSQSHFDDSSVSFSSTSKTEPCNSETEYQSTSKTPSFEELVANFDPHHIRSHDYLYSCEIKRASADFRQQLAECNWLESKTGMNNWPWYRGSIKLYNIQANFHIYTRKITIQILEVTSPDSFTNNAIADDLAIQLTAYLEDQFPGLVLYDPIRRSRLKVKKLHHAIPNHPIAIRAFELQYSSQGERFAIDNSKDNKEIEAHEHKYSTEDIDNYVEDCDYMAKNDRWVRTIDQEVIATKVLNGEINQSIKQNGESLQTLIQKVDTYSEELRNIKDSAFTHEEFQDNLLTAIDRLGSFLTDIKENITETNLILAKQEETPLFTPKLNHTYSFKERSNIEQVILTFLRERPKETGYTRNELVQNLHKKLGSISPTVSNLVKEGVILETKEGRKAGRYSLNPTHLVNQMKNNNKEFNYESK